MPSSPATQASSSSLRAESTQMAVKVADAERALNRLIEEIAFDEKL